MIVSVNKESNGKRVNEFQMRIHLQTKDQGKRRSFSAPAGRSEAFSTSTSRRVDPDTEMQVMKYYCSPGQIPWSLNGMSSWFTINPQTPFCPCLLENLSPNSGVRVCLMSTFINV